ncbi:hypothetical protein AURDEDRAFT_177225 [Auricularia subglabra TFB-10046 SS5]|uniref:Uncharacterized protein n=1 Tax=Auricularia subglabra (strain TFB-10046 / SS5) TaxID=717982 RepID=J0WMV7_AURST|nr:hypothetical protein AURDEDRAFT_177225 [Auricularia subglabra TFB-10046 SS5]
MPVYECNCLSVVPTLPEFVADHRLCAAVEIFGNQSKHRAALNLPIAKKIAEAGSKNKIWKAVAESDAAGPLLVRLLWAAYCFHATEMEAPEYSVDLASICTVKRYMLDDRTKPIFEGALSVLCDALKTWTLVRRCESGGASADLVCMLNSLSL